MQDLPRTFPGHPALDEDGRNALRRLLTAYARHNPSVGYCQVIGSNTLFNCTMSFSNSVVSNFKVFGFDLHVGNELLRWLVATAYA